MAQWTFIYFPVAETRLITSNGSQFLSCYNTIEHNLKICFLYRVTVQNILFCQFLVENRGLAVVKTFYSFHTNHWQAGFHRGGGGGGGGHPGGPAHAPW